MNQNHAIAIIGTGMDEPTGLEAHPGLAGAEAVIGGRRLLQAVAAHPARKIPVGKNLAAVLEEAAVLLAQGRRVAVLASGDPLFFGIGAAFAQRFGAERLRVYPAVSSLQAAAARLALPWANVRAVSLHGRGNYLPLAHAALGGGPFCLLTDATHTPAAASAFLRERGRTAYRVHVFTGLGGDAENIWQGDMAEAAVRIFDEPNVVFFLPDPALPAPLPLCPGQPDDAYVRENELITKWPVRAAALASLRIEPGHEVWDLGAGSGSVAVEAASLAREGHVTAVEQNAARVAHIEENRRRFGAANLEIVHATLPESLDGLPEPDRVFIGGGLGGAEEKARDIVHGAWSRLRPGGRVTAACVLLSGLDMLRKEFAALGAPAEVAMVHAALAAPLGNDTHLVAQNPVFLLSAWKY